MRADATNESYYEDAFIDTTFLGRQLVGTPEERVAGVISAVLAGTRNDRETRYRLQTEASVGNLQQRGFANLQWKSRVGQDWTLHLDPTAEYRRDRTFDRDLTEWRGAMRARARRTFLDDMTAAEFGTGADVLRSSGLGAAFLPDRQSLVASAVLDHLGLLGDEWRIGYRLTGRAFPDSADRDHAEHGYEGRWKVVGESGRWLAVDVDGSRRVTLREVSTSRDNFWITSGGLEGRVDVAGPVSVTARVEGDATHYDLQDSTLYFDYHVLRAATALRYEADARWAASLGPRIEVLEARLNPGERYRELGGVLDFEYLGAGSWWSATPAAGWRDYDDTESAGPGTPALHSSYAFYGFDLVADQVIPAGLRLKVLAALRWEYHVDPSQDARSVYASVELSRSLR